ncbi:MULTISPECIES: YjdJ family protein [Bacillaceae]|uniref:YjdJ family protein n=1 Tax=Bacillaceae TaxID=186817 RepID=UPI001E375121|nr:MULTISPECIES: YjdJ family protein [Bacillaceae]
MRVRYSIQLCIAVMFLLFSTGAAWYEGSGILSNPWEWKYSTPFSQLLHGEVEQQNDISQLDFFVYAGKFQPLFPVLMMVSFLYLVLLSGYMLLKRSRKKIVLFISIIGVLLLLSGSLISNSPTTGGYIFTMLLVTSGIVCLVFAFVFQFRVFRRLKNFVQKSLINL